MLSLLFPLIHPAGDLTKSEKFSHQKITQTCRSKIGKLRIFTVSMHMTEFLFLFPSFFYRVLIYAGVSYRCHVCIILN